MVTAAPASVTQRVAADWEWGAQDLFMAVVAVAVSATRVVAGAVAATERMVLPVAMVVPVSARAAMGRTAATAEPVRIRGETVVMVSLILPPMAWGPEAQEGTASAVVAAAAAVAAVVVAATAVAAGA